MANSIGVDEALSYKECSVSFQKVEGEKFIQLDVSPQMQAGDAILDLGCGTGQLSAYLAELVGPEGKVVGVDPDKERILLAQQSYSEVKNLSFVEGSASNFPGIGSESYDVIFSNYVIHWIPDKQDLFNNMFESLKCGGKIAIQFLDGLDPSALHAFKVLNPENADRIISRMLQCEDKAKVRNYCSKAGFDIVKCYYSTFSELVFQSIEGVLKWLSATTHGAFDPKLVTEERLQKYYPYSSRDGKPPFDLRAGFKDQSGACRLVAVKPAGQTL